ncbi:MAG: hypothetical protein ACI4P4_16135, partial [Faecousia sp.]
MQYSTLLREMSNHSFVIFHTAFIISSQKFMHLSILCRQKAGFSFQGKGISKQKSAGWIFSVRLFKIVHIGFRQLNDKWEFDALPTSRSLRASAHTGVAIS